MRRATVALIAGALTCAVVGSALFRSWSDGSHDPGGAFYPPQHQPAAPPSGPEVDDAGGIARPPGPGQRLPLTDAADTQVAVSGIGHTIHGRVVDAIGSPVEGAAVELAPRLSEGAARVASAAESVPGFRWAGHTDASGRFEARGLPAGEFRLQVLHEAFAPAGASFRWSGLDDLTLHDLRLEPGAVLRGVVLDGSRAPVAGAVLYLVRTVRGLGGEAGGGLPDLRVGTSGADGRFTTLAIGPGAWDLRVEAAEFAPQTWSGASARADAEHDLELVLRGGLAIAGAVVDHQGSGIGGVDVYARLVAGPADTAGLTSSHIARTGPDGGFRIPGLLGGSPAARYRLEARLPGPRLVRLTHASEVAAGASDVVLQCAPPAFVELTVTGGDGRAFVPSAVEVEWHAESTGRSTLDASALDRVRARPDGSLLVGPLPVAGEVSAVLELAHPGLETTTVPGLELAPGRTLTLAAVVMPSLPRLTVRVYDKATGAPLEAARVTAFPRLEPGASRYESWGSGPRRATTGVDGIASVAVDSGHAYLVTAALKGYAAPKPRPGSPSQLGSVDQVELALSPGARLDVEVVNASGAPVDGARVELTGHDDDLRMKLASDEGLDSVRVETTAAGGTCTFAGVYPGLHYARVADGQGDERPWTELFLREGEQRRLRLEIAVRALLTGTVTLGGEPLTDAWVAAIELPVERPQSYAELQRRGALRRTAVGGRFDLGPQPCATYRLVVFSERLALSFRAQHIHDAAGAPVSIEVPEVRVVGRVVDEEGAPVPDALVALARSADARAAERLLRSGELRRTGLPRGEAGIPVAVDAQGGFALPCGETHQPFLLLAFASGRCTSAAEVDPRRTLELDAVVLPRGGALAIETVATFPGRGRVLAVARPAAGTPGIERSVRLRQGRESPVTDLAPGRWHVEARLQASLDDEGELLAESEVTVRGGETTQVTLQW